MKKYHELGTEATLSIEGDRGAVINALRGAGLTYEFEEYIGRSSPIHEDDPDAGWFGSIPVVSLEHLGGLLECLRPTGASMLLEMSGSGVPGISSVSVLADKARAELFNLSHPAHCTVTLDMDAFQEEAMRRVQKAIAVLKGGAG
ncbi:MAG: hypothetical protein OEY63_06200 [Gemmatimonadota bacterium]|nr:hypothetical protein [Gemmatimonadota bacterium]